MDAVELQLLCERFPFIVEPINLHQRTQITSLRQSFTVDTRMISRDVLNLVPVKNHYRYGFFTGYIVSPNIEFIDQRNKIILTVGHRTVRSLATLFYEKYLWATKESVFQALKAMQDPDEVVYVAVYENYFNVDSSSPIEIATCTIYTLPQGMTMSQYLNRVTRNDREALADFEEGRASSVKFVTCTRCENRIRENSRFCTQCGNPVKGK